MKTSTLIKKAARLLEKKANLLLKPYDITHGYTYFLMELYKKDGQTQAELQRAIGGIENPTIVRTLDRMERDGLVERKQSQTDRRAFLIYLTEKGNLVKKMSSVRPSLLMRPCKRIFQKKSRSNFNLIFYG